MQRRRPPSAIDVALKGEREKDLVLRIRSPTYPRRVLFQKERSRACAQHKHPNKRVDYFFPVSHQFMRMQVRRIETLGPQLCSGADV